MAEKASSPVPVLDAFAPKQIAERVQKAGITKANLDFITMFGLAILAGSFIGLGAEFSTLAITDIDVGFGLTKLIGGFVFSLGLILVVIAGAELFTGNNLLTIAWLSGAVPFNRVLRNWIIVFVGNLVGSLALAVLMFYTRQWTGASYAVGVTALRIALGKVTLSFETSFVRGILCNILVCLAVWLCFAARTVADRIMAIVFPITAFVASSFEHSVANMYFIPYGLLLGTQPEVVSAAGLSAADLSQLTIWGFVNNLIPVTLGNLFGGGIMVGMMYWFMYLRKEPKEALVEERAPAPSERVPVPVEGSAMVAATHAGPRRVTLFSYPITSADMFYSEMGQREVAFNDDPVHGYSISGEIPNVGGSTISLPEALLEYAMTCIATARGDTAQAYRQMDDFGKRLGEGVAVQVLQSTPAEAAAERASCAMECVLRSMNVPFTLDKTDSELRYSLSLCPLCETSEESGLRHVELGHHGINALFRGLIRALDPALGIRLPSISHSDHIFAVRTPIEADVVVHQ